MNETLSFVIPVYNEENRIQNALTSLRSFVVPENLELEKIIFVDDGSTDSTVAIINQAKTTLEKKTGAEVVVVAYPVNRGKGYAVKQGMLESDSDYTLFFDADMSTPLTEIKKFLPFMRVGVDVIIGTRKNGESTVVVHQPRFRELMGRVFTLISQIVLNTWVTDFTCGFKAFSREAKNGVFSRSRIERWSYDAEILYIARKLGCSMLEKAVLWSDDKNTRVKLVNAVFTSAYDLLRMRINGLLGRYNFAEIKKLLVKLALINQ